MAMIYCVVVRRFMYLEINENDFLNEDKDKIPKQENAIPKLKLFCLKFWNRTQLRQYR